MVVETQRDISIERDAPISTWFGVGGRAAMLACPNTSAQLRTSLDMDPKLRVLGEGANLLVADDGVDGLVVSLTQGEFVHIEQLPGTEGCPDNEHVCVRAGAGVDLRKLVVESVRLGLGGLEGLGGIPATVGGALVMNAGGRFGQLGDVVRRVFVMDRRGHERVLERNALNFGYRTSSLGKPGITELAHPIVIGCEFELMQTDPVALRKRFKEVMAYKKHSQPMGEKSAGCCYKNPLLAHDMEELGAAGVGKAGSRISAGLLIDRAGCKGLRVGGAWVSQQHANFFPVDKDATARDVITLMQQVEARVFERFGIALEREVVIWQREANP